MTLTQISNKCLWFV